MKSRITIETFYEIFPRLLYSNRIIKDTRELLIYRLEFDGIIWQSQGDHALFLNHDGNVPPINQDCDWFP